MKIFITGASGYIGGSLAVALVEAGHEVIGLVRAHERAKDVQALHITPVIGTLEDTEVLSAAARDADAVINAASADDRGAAIALLDALSGSGKAFLHTSGSSVVGTAAGGNGVDDVYDEETPLTPSPARAARVALNNEVLGYAEQGVRSIVVCPSLIYGNGHGVKRDSMQIPWLIALAAREGVAKHLGPGENIWSNVHIDDLVALYLLALESAPAGAFYFAENGECSMRTACAAIHRMMGIDGPPVAMSVDEASGAWGEGPAQNTMGSNSRVRAVRARRELNWSPTAPSLLHEIEFGCYASQDA